MDSLEVAVSFAFFLCTPAVSNHLDSILLSVSCLMACSLFVSLCLDFAAAEGRAVSDLLASLAGWGGTKRIRALAARIHPPAQWGELAVAAPGVV